MAVEILNVKGALKNRNIIPNIPLQNKEHIQSIGRKGSKAAEFDRPRSLAFTSTGNIVVADTGNQRVQVCGGEWG